MASVGVRGDLTEANLRRLQPSLIQPMPPVTVSSGDDDDKTMPAAGAAGGREDPAVAVARLRIWVFNAMLTLAGLGSEGETILAQDELYIAGPGDVRLRPTDGTDDDDAAETRVAPDLNDPAFWQAKLRYLEAKCRPLSQERRKRRRLAPKSEIAAEDAARADAEALAAKGGGFAVAANPVQGDAGAELSPEDLQRQQEESKAREEARAEQERVDQSKLLWREKRGRIDRWVQSLTPPALTRCSEGGYSWLAAGVPPHAAPFAGDIGGPPLPKIVDTAGLSDSSIVEITPAQFSNEHEHRARPTRRRQEYSQDEEEDNDDDDDDEDEDEDYDDDEDEDGKEEDDDDDDNDNDDDDDVQNSEVVDLLYQMIEQLGEATGQQILDTAVGIAVKQAEKTKSDIEAALVRQQLAAKVARRREEGRGEEMWWAEEEILKVQQEREQQQPQEQQQQQQQQPSNLLKPQSTAVAGDTSLDLSATATVPQNSATATPAVDTPTTSASPGGERTNSDDTCVQGLRAVKKPSPGQAGDATARTSVLGKRRRSDTNVDDNDGPA